MENPAETAAMEPRSTLEQLDELFRAQDRSDGPGFSVGIAQHGKTVYRKAFGLASIEHSVANTVKTRMRIGSTSKHFACIAALVLAEQGKLDLDGTVDCYYPELPELLGYPTLRQLMNHTSGYRDMQEIAFNAAGLTVQPAGKILQALCQQTGVAFAPGDAQLYSNAGYYLLSEIIARISGMTFERFLRENLFEPLNMHDTECIPGDMAIHQGVATLHLPQPDGSFRRGILVNEETSGNGGIVSTIDDMLLWATHVRKLDTICEPSSWKQLFAATTLNNNSTSTYGLGIWRYDYRGLDLIQHAGGVIGGNSQMLIAPGEDLEVVIMTNTDGISAASLALQALEIMLPDRLTPPLVPAASNGFEHLFGSRYRNSRGVVIGFDDVAGYLGISMHLSPHAPVLYADDEGLGSRFEDLAMGPFYFSQATLTRGEDGAAPETINMRECGNDTEFQLLSSSVPTLQAVAEELVGEYHSHDMDTRAWISWDGERLRMRYAGGYGARELELDAVATDLFGVTALDPIAPTRYPLTVLRDTEHVSGFLICSARARDICFTRLPPRNTPQSERTTV